MSCLAGRRLSRWTSDGVQDLRQAAELERVRTVLRGISTSRLLLVAVAAVATMVGGCAQIIYLNKWLAAFPVTDPLTGGPVGGPFTVVVAANVACTIVFVAVQIVDLILRPKARRYLWAAAVSGAGMPQGSRFRAWLQVWNYGLLSACNAIFVIYGTKHVPELAQTLIIASRIVVTICLSSMCGLMGRRSYVHLMVVLAVVLSVGGLVCGVSGNIAAFSMNDDSLEWLAVMALGLVCGAASSVVAAVFFRASLPKENEGNAVIAKTSPADELVEGSSLTGTVAVATAVGDHTAAQWWFQGEGNIIGVILTFLFYPLDWAPWFGAHPGDAPASNEALKAGMSCIVGGIPGCTDTISSFFVFVFSSCVMNDGATALNRFSPPIAGLVGQISAPLCAIVLVIFPGLSVSPTAASIPANVAAVFLLGTGSLLFGLWEQLGDMTKIPQAAVTDGVVVSGLNDERLPLTSEII